MSKDGSKYRSAFLTSLRQHPDGLSRAQLASEHGVMRSTASKVVRGLLDEGLLYEPGLPEEKRRGQGRPGVRLKLSSKAGVAIGCVVSPDVDEQLEVEFVSVDYANSVTPPETVRIERNISAVVEFIQELVGVYRADVISIGIPGIVANNSIRVCPNAPELQGYGLYQRIIEKYPELSLSLTNDVNLAALSSLERYSWESFVYLYVGYGVGAGLVLNGDLYKGGAGAAGEIGHLQYLGTRDSASVEDLLGFRGRIADAGFSSANQFEEMVRDWRNKIEPGFGTLTEYGVGLNHLIQMLHWLLDLDGVILDVDDPVLTKWALSVVQDAPCEVREPITNNGRLNGAAIDALSLMCEKFGEIGQGERIKAARTK